MRVIAGKSYKRVSLFVLSVGLVVSSLTMAAPSFFSQIAHAIPADATVCVSSCDYSDLQTAVDGILSGQTLRVESNLTTGTRVTITQPLTIEGNGYTIFPSYIKTSTSNNSGININGTSNVTINSLTIDGVDGINLHGLQAYESTNISLNNVSLINNDYTGLVVNGSTVTVNNINTAGNGWHGINVDLGSGVPGPAVLTVNGVSTHSELVPDIYIDNTIKNVTVNDTNSQYNTNHLSGNDLAYFIKPDAPTINTPTNEQYFNSTPIINSWTTVNYTRGISKYQIEYVYDDHHTFPDAPYRYVNSPATSRNHIPNVSEQGGITIRVRAMDMLSNYGQWSNSVHYYYDSIASNTPTPYNPNSDQDPFSTNTGFTQSWSNESISGAAKYNYESCYQNTMPIGDSCGTGVVGWAHTYTGTSKTVGSGQPDSHFFWHIQSEDTAGNKSGWSDWREIVIDKGIPTDLKHLSPSNGTITKTADLASIDWTDATDISIPVSYYYQSSHSSATNTDGSFVSPVYSSGALSSSGIPTPGTPEGVYYWHVKAVDALGNSTPWTLPWVVTVDNTPPHVEITSPTNSLLNTDAGVRVIATDANLRHYWVKITRDGTTVYNQTTMSSGVTDHLVYTATQDGVYVVTLAARDLVGGGSYTGHRSTDVTKMFIVDKTAPVVTIDPQTATTNNTPTITGTVDDATATVTVTIDGTPYLATNNGDGTWSLNLLTPIADGFHTLTAIGEDTLGNATTPAAMSSITITVSLATQPAAGARLVSTPIATTTTTQAADTAVTDAGIAANDAQTGEVLGEQTTTPNTDKNSDTAVKGDSTTKKDDGSNTWSLFGLAWYWWLLIVAAIAAGWWFLVARRRMNQE